MLLFFFITRGTYIPQGLDITESYVMYKEIACTFCWYFLKAQQILIWSIYILTIGTFCVTNFRTEYFIAVDKIMIR